MCCTGHVIHVDISIFTYNCLSISWSSNWIAGMYVWCYLFVLFNAWPLVDARNTSKITRTDNETFNSIEIYSWMIVKLVEIKIRICYYQFFKWIFREFFHKVFLYWNKTMDVFFVYAHQYLPKIKCMSIFYLFGMITKFYYFWVQSVILNYWILQQKRFLSGFFLSLALRKNCRNIWPLSSLM